VSSTLAEALALLIAVQLYASPGILIAQTDSNDLFLAWSRGRSNTATVNAVVAATAKSAKVRGCHLVLHHILRHHNSVSDAMAAGKPIVRVARALTQPTPLARTLCS
jgi:hypothetical protein